jgi:hypothetical protein
MPNATYFVQECPTCGRRLQIRVEYLGKKVACQHCQGRFLAVDPASCRSGGASSTGTLLERANALLDSVAKRGTRNQPAMRR